MYQIDAAEAVQGIGLWGACFIAFCVLWYFVGYLFGDRNETEARHPAQNFYRRFAGWVRWLLAVIHAALYGVDAAMGEYYRQRKKAMPTPRNEKIEPPVLCDPVPAYQPRRVAIFPWLARLKRGGAA
jgi:hypothetical protein